MTLKDIEDTIGKNALSYSKISASDLVSIMEYVNVKLLMDRKCFDYYYEIETNELLESKMPTEFLSVLQDLGWAFNSDKSKILIYLKMVNVNFVGRLGGDSEIKESNGKQFIVMRVAVDDYNFSTKEKTTQWINVTSHNSNVMNMQQYLKKGSSVMVLGTSRIRTYVNKEQVVVPTMDVFADRIEFVGGSSKETSDQTTKNVDFGTLPSTSQASATQQTQQQTVASSAPNVNVDDLPF